MRCTGSTPGKLQLAHLPVLLTAMQPAQPNPARPSPPTPPALPPPQVWGPSGKRRPPAGRWVSTGKEALKSGLNIPGVAESYDEGGGSEPGSALLHRAAAGGWMRSSQ